MTQKIDGVSHIIVVSSGKGGVGKSTLSANLATALRLEGAKVGLIDADVYGPSIPQMLGVLDLPEFETDSSGKEWLVPPQANGVKVISMGFLMDPEKAAAWRGPMLHKTLRQFFTQVKWGELDYLLIDMPPGTGDVQLSVQELVDVSGALIVTTPQEVSVQDVKRAISMFQSVNVPLLGVIENMSFFMSPNGERLELFGKGGGKRISEHYALELLAELPLDPDVRELADRGFPAVIERPLSEFSQKLRLVSKRLVERLVELDIEKPQIKS